MQKFKDFLKKYGFFIRIFFLSFAIFLSTKTFSFSSKKDDELAIYFNKNLNIINHYCDPSEYRLPRMSSVTFNEIKIPDAIAYCEPRVNGFKLVFDKRYWGTLSDLDKTQLMFHEMVHCMFNQDHVDDPNHFMYPTMNSLDGLTLAIQVHSYLTAKCVGSK